jgi:predicted metal-dependent hydrolase
MRKRFVHTHSLAGDVILFVDSRAKKYIAKIREGQLHVTVPETYTLEQVNEFLDSVMKQVSDEDFSLDRRIIDENFYLETTNYTIRCSRIPGKRSTLKQEGTVLHLYLSDKQDIRTEAYQKGVKRAIEKAMREYSSLVLVNRFRKLAFKKGACFRDVKIGSLKHAWGKCSGAGMITLSPYLILLPDHLIDYVMLHELSHLKEMNHSAAFWEKLDALCEGKAFALDQELKNFTTSITHLLDTY